MFYCHNISGCHVALLNGRKSRVIQAQGRWWLSHVTLEPNGLMLWSKASLSTCVLGLFSCLLRGETKTVSTSCPRLVQLQKLKAGTSLVVQWLKLQLPMQGAWVQSLARELRSHMLQFSSVAQSYLTLCDPKTQHVRPPCPSITPGDYSNSCPSSQWCHPTISSSVILFSPHLQSFPASGSFQMSYFFPEGGRSIGVSASASVLPMNIQDWFPLGWTDWISLQSKGLSRDFSNITVQ